MRTILFCSFLFLLNCLSAQDTAALSSGPQFQLVSVRKPSHIKNIGSEAYVTISLIRPDSAGYHCSDYLVTGNVECIAGDSVCIRVSEVSIHYDGQYGSFSREYSFDDDRQAPLWKYSWNEMLSMSLDRKFGNVFAVPGSILAFSGIMGGLFAAPLIGYEWGYKSFNGKRYLQFMKYCLFSLAAGVALVIPGNIWSEWDIRCGKDGKSGDWYLQRVPGT